METETNNTEGLTHNISTEQQKLKVSYWLVAIVALLSLSIIGGTALYVYRLRNRVVSTNEVTVKQIVPSPTIVPTIPQDRIYFTDPKGSRYRLDTPSKKLSEMVIAQADYDSNLWLNNTNHMLFIGKSDGAVHEYYDETGYSPPIISFKKSTSTNIVNGTQVELQTFISNYLISPDGRYVFYEVSVGGGGGGPGPSVKGAYIEDTASHQRITVPENLLASGIRPLGFDPAGNFLIIYDPKGQGLVAFDPDSGRTTPFLPKNQLGDFRMYGSTDEKLIDCGGAENCVAFWNNGSGLLVLKDKKFDELIPSSNPEISVSRFFQSISPSGRYLLFTESHARDDIYSATPAIYDRLAKKFIVRKNLNGLKTYFYGRSVWSNARDSVVYLVTRGDIFAYDLESDSVIQLTNIGNIEPNAIFVPIASKTKVATM